MSKSESRSFLGKIFRMRSEDREILKIVGLNKEQAGLARYFDFFSSSSCFFIILWGISSSCNAVCW